MWYRAQVIQHYYTGLPKDVAVNNLYFESGSAEPAEGEMTRIKTVINSAWAGLEDYRAGVLATTGGMSVKIYDVTAPPGSSPLSTGGPYTMGAPTTTANLPLEVAGCISFRGPNVAGTVPARRRGRNYIGPLNTSASAPGDGTTPPALSAGFISALTSYAQAIWDANSGAGSVTWCVYSPTDSAMIPVTNCWVDNAFDTQRRRGNDATARTNYTPT